MQKAETVLSILKQKSKQDESHRYDRIYRNLFNEDFFLRAYQKIHAKQGNMTPGTDGTTIIVAPITSRTHTKAKLPTHTEVKDFDKLDKDSIILLEQIRTIDKQRLKQYIGLMPNHIMARVDKALAISLAMNGEGCFDGAK